MDACPRRKHDELLGVQEVPRSPGVRSAHARSGIFPLVADGRTETHIFLEHAHTFEGVGSRVSEIAHELADQGCVVSSVSHTIDEDDPAGRYQVIVIGLPIDASRDSS
jgi:hypothetical protein